MLISIPYLLYVCLEMKKKRIKKNDKCVNLTQEVAVQFPTELLFC